MENDPPHGHGEPDSRSTEQPQWVPREGTVSLISGSASLSDDGAQEAEPDHAPYPQCHLVSHAFFHDDWSHGSLSTRTPDTSPSNDESVTEDTSWSSLVDSTTFSDSLGTEAQSGIVDSRPVAKSAGPETVDFREAAPRAVSSQTTSGESGLSSIKWDNLKEGSAMVPDWGASLLKSVRSKSTLEISQAVLIQLLLNNNRRLQERTIDLETAKCGWAPLRQSTTEFLRNGIQLRTHITKIPGEWFVDVISVHCQPLGLSVALLQKVQNFSVGSLWHLVQFIYAFGDTTTLPQELLNIDVLRKVLDARWQQFGRHRIDAAWVHHNVCPDSGYIHWARAGVFEYTKFNDAWEVTEVTHRPTMMAMVIDPDVMSVKSRRPPTTNAIGDNHSDLDAYTLVQPRSPRNCDHWTKVNWIVVFCFFSNIWVRPTKAGRSDLANRPDLLDLQEAVTMPHPSGLNWRWRHGRVLLSTLSDEMIYMQGLLNNNHEENID